MTGTVTTPAVITGTADISTGQTLSPAFFNAFRISSVTGRLLAHVHGEILHNDSEFCNLCLSLSRGIDYAVSNNEIPGRAPDLPYLLKQVCQRKNDFKSQAAIMVLMISIKSACSNGWFSEKEKEELNVLSNKMQSGYCSVSVNDLNSNMKNKETNIHPIISTILLRFYPGMKMGEIFYCVETTPGYNSYVTDMYISPRSRISLDDKIYLFVAQTDNVETSSCLINPQQVNFLLNGEGVDRRTCLYKDPGPQMPTPVTHMLQYGSNLLQIVGQFNGRYIIVIGYMSVVSNPGLPTIPDYVPPVRAEHDSDNEIIEGPSRVSLKCPISFNRIKIPVKGHSCKHLQCFDFKNYVEINSRRPLWRCPHCNQSVCFQDIRVDQSMVKVLKDVGEDVSYIKISCNGSWEAITETVSNAHTKNQNDVSHSNQETTSQNMDDIMDLTENDKDDEKQPLPAGVSRVSSVMNNIIPTRMKEAYWRELCSSALASRATNNARSVVNDAMQKNRLLFNSLTQGQSQSQTTVSNNMHLQQKENSTNNSNNNRHLRYKSPASWVTGVTRIPNAIQALPAQHSARSHLNQHTSQSQSQSQISGSRYTSPFSADRLNSTQQGSSVEESADENCRPSGRMRGSLSVRQFTEALKNQSIIQPSEPVQPVQPPPVLNTPRPFIPPHLQSLMANNPRPQSGVSGSGSGLGSDRNMSSSDN